MFGLEDKNESVADSYELEDDLKNAKKAKETRDHIENRISSIKELLRGGADKEMFNTFGNLLMGYIAMKRVVERILYTENTSKKG